MFRLIIAEDEALAREAITRSIDFAAHGFKLVASCEDGREALEAYRREGADLLITDIYMPQLSGLELARTVHENGDRCRVVIITGHDNFDFARQAIRYQVSDYLLKPITPQEFRNTLDKYRGILSTEAEKQEEMEARLHRSYRNESLARNQLLNRFVSGSLSGDEEAALRASLGDGEAEGASNKLYMIGLLRSPVSEETLRHLGMNDQDVHFLLLNVAEELAQTAPSLTVFPSVENAVLLLLLGSRPEQMESEILGYLEKLSRTFADLTKLPVRSAYSQAASAENLGRAKEEARQAMNLAVASRSREATSYARAKWLARQNCERRRTRLLQLMRNEERDKLEGAVGDYAMALDVVQMDGEKRQEELTELEAGLERQKQAVSPGFLSDGALLSAFDQGHAADFARALLREMQGILRRCASKTDSPAQAMIAKAKRHIHEHYGERSLSLISICQYLNVSISYFSSLFKKESGQTFVEYLTMVRIQAAKRLLTETDRLLYAIADEVGYDSPAYFAAAFKKNTGYTPKQYRKLYRQEET